jgi:transposase
MAQAEVSINDVIREHIYELNQEGKSEREIAKIVDTTVATVNRVLKKNGHSFQRS